MINALVLLLLLLLVTWIWLDGARAREMATALVRHHCDRFDLQFLDETVALSRMGLRWTNDGVRIRRMFSFEFSVEGMGRRKGYVLMLGMRLESIDDGLDDSTVEPTGAPSSPMDPTNVVPFRRREK